MSARLLCLLLRTPSAALTLNAAQWTSILTIAHAERLSGSLAHRLAGLDLPSVVQERLDAARLNAETGRTQALWEVEMARRAMATLNLPVVLLKGSAFVAAGLDAGLGRQIVIWIFSCRATVSMMLRPRCWPRAGSGSSPTPMTICIIAAGCMNCRR